MLLTDVRTIWGRSQLIRSLPVMEEHFNVVFVPFAADAPLEQDRHWGLFTLDGQLIDASAYRRGHHGSKVSGGEFPAIDVASLPEAPLQHYVYGGPIINHFGHFLITSLARFWLLGRHELHGPIVCHSHGTVPDWFALPYRTQFWNGLGLDQQHFASFDQPIRIRHISIPRVSLEEQNHVHAAFGQMCRQIGDRILGDNPITPTDQPVYLSKHRMNGGVTKIGNEEEIVSFLETAGVSIVCPETLSIADQIRLFRKHRTMIGTSTSAFHMSVFSELQNQIVCLLPSDLLNSNFLLVDAVANNRSRYLFPWANTTEPKQAQGFNSFSIIEHPRAVAEELLIRSRQGAAHVAA